MKDLKKIITEDYVSFEVAKLLKEKGFNEPTWTCYAEHAIYHCNFPSSNSKLIDGTISAPTLQMVKKWLKVVHNVGIFPSTYTFSNADVSEEYHPYGCAIIDLKTHELITEEYFPRDTEEETVEEAIKFCLKSLNNN